MAVCRRHCQRRRAASRCRTPICGAQCSNRAAQRSDGERRDVTGASLAKLGAGCAQAYGTATDQRRTLHRAISSARPARRNWCRWRARRRARSPPICPRRGGGQPHIFYDTSGRAHSVARSLYANWSDATTPRARPRWRARNDAGRTRRQSRLSSRRRHADAGTIATASVIGSGERLYRTVSVAHRAPEPPASIPTSPTPPASFSATAPGVTQASSAQAGEKLPPPPPARQLLFQLMFTDRVSQPCGNRQ